MGNHIFKIKDVKVIMSVNESLRIDGDSCRANFEMLD